MRIPNYTKGLVIRRDTPDTVQLGMIGAAGAEAGAIADIADLGAELAQKMKQTDDMTAVNQAIIQKQKRDLDFNDQMRKENRDNPLGYSKRIEPLIQQRDEQIINGLANEEQKEAFRLSSERLNLTEYKQNLNWENKRSTELFANRIDSSTNELVAEAYRGRMPLEEIQKNLAASIMAGGNVYSQDQLEKLLYQKSNDITSSFIEGWIDRDPHEAKKLLDSKEYDSDLGDKLNTLNDRADVAINKLEKAQDEERERLEGISTVSQAIVGEGILDPHSADTQKSVNAYYDDLKVKMADMPPEQQQLAQIKLVSKAGIYPDQMKSELSAKIHNGSKEQKVEAAELIDAISINNGSTATQITGDERALARGIVSNINAGLKPNQAVEMAEANVFKKDTPEYRQRLENFTKKGGDKVKFKGGVYTKLFRNDPDEIPAAMQADFELLNKNYYMSGHVGGEEAAKLAEEAVTASWGITRADGKNRWMKYSPEKTYANQVGSEWIGRQLQDDIASIPQIGEVGIKPDVYLEVDPRSIREKDKVYLVFQKQANGEVTPFYEPSGQQMIFKPDYEQSKDFKEHLEKNNGDKVRAMASAVKQYERAIMSQEKRERRKRHKRERAEQLQGKIKDLFGVEDATD